MLSFYESLGIAVGVCARVVQFDEKGGCSPWKRGFQLRIL